MKLEKGQFVVGWDSYGQPVAGRVHSVTSDAVTVTPFQTNTVTVHPNDCEVIEISESPTLESRLKPHVIEHRKREQAVAEAAKAKKPAKK
jgi:hypothetical protein